MQWFKANARWAALNGVALLVLVYVLVQGSVQPQDYRLGYDAMLDSGKWALRFLLLSLTMTPLNTYFGWRNGLPLRKPAGLWAFAFAALHVLFLVFETRFGNLFVWLTPPLSLFIVFGLLGFVILAAMALTSTRWAMQKLGKNWKRLHRLVYVAGCLVVLHALLATVSTKKMIFLEAHVITELRLYTVLLALLLAVRLPMVRRGLLQAVRLPQRWSSRSTA